ncbi:MAG TPA: hypothetical protein VK979_09595 [Guyparkeria sp.]|nr:hypothetical protein [Guyparkeria sp.]
MSKKHITARLDPEIVEALDKMPGDTRADKISYAVMAAAVRDAAREEIRALGRAQTQQIDRLREELRAAPAGSESAGGVNPQLRWALWVIARALQYVVPVEDSKGNPLRKHFVQGIVNKLGSGKPLPEIEEKEDTA